MTPPDSDAREVCGVCGLTIGRYFKPSILGLGLSEEDESKQCPRFRTELMESLRGESCWRLGYERLAALVGIDPSLAKRILAALEGTPDPWNQFRPLAAELRAVIGK